MTPLRASEEFPADAFEKVFVSDAFMDMLPEEVLPVILVEDSLVEDTLPPPLMLPLGATAPKSNVTSSAQLKAERFVRMSFVKFNSCQRCR